ncbi:hypothetical protein BDV41DRAFT_568863 [Aspergillus transmontanensis]|uniref:CWH43-like N-terminal domain-containing protein n=1 Tax=Aspergillus transmontanensis TaxID=1034304 RepID=A0A5N6VHA6_9EURO|nr:hypothetical protein BDV41DRAFT_568863 [Aspergillus transmontanensis]
MSTNPLFRCYDFAWSFLHVFILNIPPSRLFLFPALAGSVWFLTLASLLSIWLAHGMPQYPGQSNQHVAFISDIAPFELKPLFLIGASITAVGFVTTVATVHVVRYEPEFSLVKCPVTNNRNDNGEHGLTGHRSSYHSHCGHHDSYSEDEEDHETTRTLNLISLGSLSSYLPTNFDGYVPSVLYGPPTQRKIIEPPESLPGQIRNWDPERAYLIEGPSGGKYT